MLISVLALLRMLLRSTVFPDPLFLAAFLMPQKPLIVLTMHYYLFIKLIQKGLPPVVNRLLFSWYSDQKSSVLWNNTLSTKFSVTNGVRQGGVLSPILFTVYIDELLLRLESRGIGCFWNHHFVGAVCYADDIVLLSPSASGLRSMLNVCSDFASRHSLIFDASKTQLVRFSLSSDTSNSCSHFLFDGHQLTLYKSANHLGHILTSDLSDDDDILASQCAGKLILCSAFFHPQIPM